MVNIPKLVMAKSLGKILVIFFLSLFQSVGAQVLDTLDENALDVFKDKRNVVERFDYFFNTLYRYNENSAYDWLDEVNVYLNTAEKSGDSTAINNYKLMQSQIYYDLGDYDKSVAIANDLYSIKDKIDLLTKRVMLDLIDNNYSQLKLFG